MSNHNRFELRKMAEQVLILKNRAPATYRHFCFNLSKRTGLSIPAVENRITEAAA